VIARGLLLATLLIALTASAGTSIVFSQEPNAEAIARAYLARSGLEALPQEAEGLGPSQQRAAAPADRGLDHVATVESDGARHVRFQETENGVPIFGAHVVVNLKKGSDEVGFVSDKRTAARVASSTLGIDPDAARDLALDAVGAEDSLQTPIADLVYYPIEKQLYLAWQVRFASLDPLGDWLVIVLADSGSVELVSNVAPQDSGQIFDPNPVAAGGGPFTNQHCDTPAAETDLQSEYVTRTLLGLDSGQDQLRGEYVDLTAPGIVGGYQAAGQASDAGHDFIYDCNEAEFEEVMVYYHIDTTQRAIQALGFTGASAILDEPIPAHAHYMAECNAFYFTIDTGLHFGDCGVNIHDTGEDGDVIIHEYGHAIQDDQVPGWGIGSPTVVEETRGMGEGFSDYLAAVMTGSPCIGDWANFGQTECPGNGTGLRYIVNNLNYDTAFEACPDNPDGSEEEHCTGEIWSGALWALGQQLGHDLTLRLVLDSHFYLHPQATFDDGLCAILAADSDLYGGANSVTIVNVFATRGIDCTAIPPADFDYAFLRIRHTYRGDLRLSLVVGPDPDSPLCNGLIKSEDIGDAGVDYEAFINLGSFCAANFPPSEATPWWLEVQDQFSGDTTAPTGPAR
jgi:Zn-dependent metalloprotease